MKKFDLHHKLLSFFLLILLSGCRVNGIQEKDPQYPDTPPRYHHTEDVAAEHAEHPHHIALLLPMTGKHADSAKAIREGFLASYYASNHATKPILRVYDTTRDGNIEELYNTAVNEGADFVVGPLSKEEVQQLSLLSSSKLKTPVLALNTTPGTHSASHDFVQFALAPEAEAEQIADKAWQQHYRSASIIVPDNDWGTRIANAFTRRWQSLGGRVLRTVRMSQAYDQSGTVRKLLGIDESQKRANEIKGILTENVEFQPRRRQDVDFIMMAAHPTQARQLKPLFDFYYAEDVPVYATSSIYAGTPNPKNDRDINGVIFCDMPWLLNPQQGAQMRQLLAKNGEHLSNDYKRLFAMGVDAYQLTGHMKYLQTHPHAVYPGTTGYLSLAHHQVIQRKLVWAKIENGVPVSVN